VYKDYGRIIRWQVSDENGVFTDRVRLDTGTDESPRLMIYSTMFSFDNVRVMDPETKQAFLELERQIKELKDKRDVLIEANWNSKMSSLTWEWMKQHQDPKVQTPEPFQHKKIITALRRGSKVMVDASSDSVRWRLAGLVGRLRKKGDKRALIEFDVDTKYGRKVRLPYYVLLPYSYQEWLREKRKIKDTVRMVKMSNQVTRALNKILL